VPRNDQLKDDWVGKVRNIRYYYSKGFGYGKKNSSDKRWFVS